MTAQKVAVDAGAHNRSGCPVSVWLPWDYREFKGALLTDETTRRELPGQLRRSGKGVTLSWISPTLKAGERRRFTVVPLPQPADAPGVTVVNDAEAFRADVWIKGVLFTTYHYSKQWVRPFLHPVIGPRGARVTRNWPIEIDAPGETRDHPHHKSLWVAHGACNNVDHWSEEGKHGWQRHRSFTRETSGPVFGQLTANIDWCTHAGRKQFEEVRDMCFYALPGGDRLFDVSVMFRMTEGKVTFYDTKEGGLLSIRVATSMDVTNGGCIENAYGGINETETWGKPSPWCDYSGVVDGHDVGVAVFDYETNPRYPTQWHVRDYGLMAANCFAWNDYRPEAKVKGDMVFEKGAKRAWRYRVLVHKGNAARGKVRERFLDFVAPPTVTVE